jgi:hypothetical protein
MSVSEAFPGVVDEGRCAHGVHRRRFGRGRQLITTG